ncbi:MAG: MBG-2 domain-containing protein, partial [Thermoguttaceae bacterium]|nr:MBG-2 domain-containing protein [Thermoguttaceae bacterium]
GTCTYDWSIGKKSLQVKVDDKTITFGDDLPRFTASFSGFVGDKVEFDGATLAIGETELGWATVSLVKANNVDKDQTTGALTEGKYLLTATGATRNTDAVFKDLGEDNITAAGAYGGSNGSAPILCEGVPATIELKGVNPAKVGVYALDARGDRSERLSVREVEGGAAFDIGAEYKTIWYEIVVAGD